MITLTILLIIALLCVLVGCLTGLLTLVGVLASLFVGVLVGALAGYLAGRFMGTETSLGRNILMGVLGSFVGEFLFGLLGIHASGSFSSFAISLLRSANATSFFIFLSVFDNCAMHLSLSPPPLNVNTASILSAIPYFFINVFTGAAGIPAHIGVPNIISS